MSGQFVALIISTVLHSKTWYSRDATRTFLANRSQKNYLK